MREIIREVPLPLAQETAFGLLHTPSAIRAWWSAACVIISPRPGGLWVATWGEDEDRPDYVTAARLTLWDPPARLRLGRFEYETRNGEGLPFPLSALETEFRVSRAPAGSVVRIRQTGFPDSPVGDEFFTSCEKGWEATCEGIERFASRAR